MVPALQKLFNVDDRLGEVLGHEMVALKGRQLRQDEEKRLNKRKPNK